MSKRDWIEVTTSLIGGAGIGAALMYLFDPETGDQRRDRLHQQAADAAAATGEALGSSWNTVADSARHIGQRAMEYGDMAKDHAMDWGGNVANSARSAAQYLSNKASHLGSKAQSARSDAEDWMDDAHSNARKWGRNAMKSARGYGRDAHQRAGNFLGYQQGPTAGSIVGVTVGVVGALALGAGLMFLFDPSQGRRRRAIARDKTMDYARNAGQYAQETAHNVADKARGVAQQVGSAAEQVKSKITGSTAQTADQLTESVRKEVQHLSGELTGVEVRAENGRVTLTGSAPASRVDEILSVIRKLPGVNGIDNHLNVQSSVM